MIGAILINAYASSEDYLYQPRRLKEEFEKLNVSIDIIRNNSFDSFLDGGLKSNLCKYDFIIYLDKDKYILDIITKLGIPVFNSYDSIIKCDDKMTTYIELASKGFPVPKTYPGLLCYSPEEKIPNGVFEAIETKLAYPLVAKTSYGSLGKEVFLINNRKDLEEISEKLKLTPHLFQEAITSSFGKDLRIIVIGDKAIGGMLRQSKNDFRSNIGSGGYGEKFELSDDLKTLAVKVSKSLGLIYSGIDILFNKNSYLICEVNSNAFFKSFEAVTGINVAKEYAQEIIKDLTK